MMFRKIRRFNLPNLLVLALVGGVGLLLSSCKPERDVQHPPRVNAEILAEVEGQSITATDYHYWSQRKKLKPDAPAARAALLDQLIERAALVGAAREAGLDHDLLIQEQLENLLIKRLEEAQLHPQLKDVVVSDEEIRSYYESQKSIEFASPSQDHLAALWFATRGQSPLLERYRPRLEQVRTQVLASPGNYPPSQGFGELAIANTEHRGSRYNGGDLGWIEATPYNGFLGTIQTIGHSLKQVGDVSEVQANDQGVFLVRLIERRPGTIKEFSSVEATIRGKLRQQKQDALEREFRARIIAAAKVARYPAHLDVLPPQLISQKAASQPIAASPFNLLPNPNP